MINAKKKRVLFIFSLSTAAALAIILIFVINLDINSYIPRIEAIASKKIGRDVNIKGKIGISLFPVGISAKNIQITNKGSEILSLESLNAGVEFVPLLKKQIKITILELVKPAFNIEKDAKGKYNFETVEKKHTKQMQAASFRLAELKLSGGMLVYTDKKQVIR